MTLTKGENTITIKSPIGETLLLDKFVTSEVQEEVILDTYYVSADGNDLNTGTIDSPWKTLVRASQAALPLNEGGIFKAGDKLLFRKGDTFLGNLVIKSVGTEDEPIEISSYGEGELPIISGSGAIEGGDYFEAIKYINVSHVIMSNIWVKNDRQNSDRSNWGAEKSFGILVVANKWATGISENLIFRDLKITDVFGTSLPEDFDALNVTGLRFESDSSEVDKTITIKDVLIEDCYFSNIGKAGVWSIHKGKGTEDDEVNRSLNFIIKNNHFEKTGGSGIILSKVKNALVENNFFDHSGHSDPNEPRLVGRGSGMWVFSSTDILAQYNTSLSIRGYNDSYGMHIDFGNKNIIFQYNYSEDSEGGFVEILGDNHNVAYRFNVSVNDGVRDFHGSTIWTSGFVGTTTVDGNTVKNDPIPSDGVYIYNNTIYVDAAIKPDFSLYSKNTYIYNNIFVQEGDGVIGENVEMEMQGEFIVSNNLFEGNISTEFTDLDKHSISEKPLFIERGARNKEGYQISENSPVINGGVSFPEPDFPMAGKGIFKDISLKLNKDPFGNEVNLDSYPPNIGVDNRYNFFDDKEDIELTSIEFKLTEQLLEIGEEKMLKIIFTPLDASNKNIEWKSSDNEIITVNSNGTVTALKEGDVTITAISIDGSFIAEIKLTVNSGKVTSIDNFGQEKVIIYPNPAQQILHISTDNWQGDKTGILMNLMGLEISSFKLQSKNKIRIDHLERGLYQLIIIDTDGKRKTKKVVLN
ncbi:T9SS type A sorting domain-containing protein [Flammeovirga pectinis]|uniref:T9SS type A sorting domain-containing protein n=1 Tax=Flammeovirga pectinis TaxID=2494373 RepID=A0A3Q9FU49_9BACT|nr:Ig-like domain-containing protein [Flammeovirga pectinis]AZQ64657.1 T9SS type A sorting domain-containing protein [Flammeovirga pectinis]